MIEKEVLRVKIFLFFILILYGGEIFLLIRLFFRNGRKVFFSKFTT